MSNIIEMFPALNVPAREFHEVSQRDINSAQLKQIMFQTGQLPADVGVVRVHPESFMHLVTQLFALRSAMEEVEQTLMQAYENNTLETWAEVTAGFIDGALSFDEKEKK